MFRNAMQAVGVGVLVTEADHRHPGPVIRFANQAMADLTGYSVDELVGQTPRILQGPETERASLDALRAALDARRSYNGEAVNHRKDGSSYTVDWVIDPVFNESGTLLAWIAVQRDVTERRETRRALEESERRLRVMVAELQHRTRNLIGVVSSLADQTARTSADLPEFLREFDRRVRALARVQGLLSRLGEGERVTVDGLVRSELAALNPAAPVHIDGDAAVELRSATVQTLAMALHELATNAVKYGALGRPGGWLEICWRVIEQDGRPALCIDWRERGLDLGDCSPLRRGHGRELIEQALPYQLGATTDFSFEPDGVHCRIMLPAATR